MDISKSVSAAFKYMLIVAFPQVGILKLRLINAVFKAQRIVFKSISEKTHQYMSEFKLIIPYFSSTLLLRIATCYSRKLLLANCYF